MEPASVKPLAVHTMPINTPAIACVRLPSIAHDTLLAESNQAVHSWDRCLQDLIELRAARWVARRKKEEPKLIAEIHEEARIQLAAIQSRHGARGAAQCAHAACLARLSHT